MYLRRIPGFQPKRIQITDRISFHISIAVQALAAVYASCQNILINKAFDVDIVVAGTHVIQSICIAGNTVLSVIEIIYFTIFTVNQFAIWCVGVCVFYRSFLICDGYRTADIIIVIDKII